jgi:hypothetical protein
MYEVKWSNDPRRGGGKAQSNMLTNLTGMTQEIISVSRAGDDRAAQQLEEDIRVRVTEVTMLGSRGSGNSQGVRDSTWGRCG